MFNKTIQADDASTALVDALADLLHVHGGDWRAVLEELDSARGAATGHYVAERDGEDGAAVTVVRS